MADFTRRTLMGAALAAPVVLAVSDRVRIGLIGCGGISGADTNAFLATPGTEIPLICDVDEAMMGQTADRLKRH